MRTRAVDFRVYRKLFVGLSFLLSAALPGFGAGAQVASAASGTAAHGSLSACQVATNADAALALHQKVESVHKWAGGGFSECIFVAGNGKFVVFYITTDSMLSAHFGYHVTAEQEAHVLQHGLPNDLKRIGPNRYLVNSVGFGEWKQDVLMVDTMGFMRGHHHISNELQRLQDMITPIIQRV
jgi:hypothetical protein